MSSPETALLRIPRKDPITCHVLDQTTGHPAPSLHVTLTLLQPFHPSAPRFKSTTSAEGRITSWIPHQEEQAGYASLADLLKTLSQERRNSDEAMLWSLRFETERYFGKGKTFYPEVEVKFFVDGGVGGEEDGRGHVHVPLLLAPWGYTTYRGS